MEKVTRLGFRCVNALVLVVLAGPAHAECMTAQAWLRDVRAHSVAADVQITDDVTGEAAQVAIAKMNAIPPVTYAVADEIVVIGATDVTTKLRFDHVLVGYFVKGCLKLRQQDDAESVAVWLRGDGA